MSTQTQSETNEGRTELQISESGIATARYGLIILVISNPKLMWKG